MPVKSLMKSISGRIAECETESRLYEEQIKRGSEVFESARSASFFDGKAEALTEVFDDLELLTAELVGELSIQAS